MSEEYTVTLERIWLKRPAWYRRLYRWLFVPGWGVRKIKMYDYCLFDDHPNFKNDDEA